MTGSSPAGANSPPPSARAWRWAGYAAMLAGLALLVGFGLRAWHQYQFAQRVASGQVQVETLRGWMTLPYVARLYGVPEARLREALGVPPTGGEDRSVREWIEIAGLDPLEGRQRLEAVVLQAREPPEPRP